MTEKIQCFIKILIDNAKILKFARIDKIAKAMRIPESELIINADGSAFHLHIKPDQLADKVILMGDPGRIALFKEHFDSVECEGGSREFNWFTGIYKGSRMTALSTGIGTDNIDIVMTELDALANIDFETREVKTEHKSLNVVRVGTCGAIQPDIPLGSFILSHYSVGFDGLMGWYENRDAVTDKDMEKAFTEYMHWPEVLPVPYFVHASQKLIDLFSDSTVRGMTIASPGFYGPQGRCVRLKPVIPNLVEKIEGFRYKDWKITNFEMEGSALAGMAAQLGHDAITVCAAIAHRHFKDSNTDYKSYIQKLLTIILDKLAIL